MGKYGFEFPKKGWASERESPIESLFETQPYSLRQPYTETNENLPYRAFSFVIVPIYCSYNVLDLLL